MYHEAYLLEPLALYTLVYGNQKKLPKYSGVPHMVRVDPFLGICLDNPKSVIRTCPSQSISTSLFVRNSAFLGKDFLVSSLCKQYQVHANGQVPV